MSQATYLIARTRGVVASLLVVLMKYWLGSGLDGIGPDWGEFLAVGRVPEGLQSKSGFVRSLLVVRGVSEGGQGVDSESSEWLLPHFLSG